MPIGCRFYKHKYPEIDDVVMVNVRSIAEMGAYVNLLEYNNIEGMILLSELSRRRIRSINKLIRVGRNECVAVIRVDKDKGLLLFCYLIRCFKEQFFAFCCRHFDFIGECVHVFNIIHVTSDLCPFYTTCMVV